MKIADRIVELAKIMYAYKGIYIYMRFGKCAYFLNSVIFQVPSVYQANPVEDLWNNNPSTTITFLRCESSHETGWILSPRSIILNSLSLKLACFLIQS